MVGFSKLNFKDAAKNAVVIALPVLCLPFVAPSFTQAGSTHTEKQPDTVLKFELDSRGLRSYQPAQAEANIEKSHPPPMVACMNGEEPKRSSNIPLTRLDVMPHVERIASGITFLNSICAVMSATV